MNRVGHAARAWARCGAAIAFAATLLCPALLAQGAIPSMPLERFQDSLGVNVHMEYTDGKYADAERVLADLRYLGIHNLRDDVPRPKQWMPPGQGVAAIKMLGAHGIRFNMPVAVGTTIPDDMEQVKELLASTPGMIVSLEGLNEINNWPMHAAGMSDEQAAEAFQHTLYTAVKADSATRALPVLYLTGGAPMDLHTHPGLADTANTHPYPHNGEQPFGWLRHDFGQYFPNLGDTPRIITETGYYTLPQSRDWGGVDEATQAIVLLNTYFDAALQGVERTYVYQLLDPYADPKQSNNDDHFGFFRFDGTPKPSGWAMHQLALALPPDKPSPQRAVDATITGLPVDTGHALALTASDGSIVIFTWNESPVWNESALRPIEVAPVPTRIQMGGSWQVSYFDPSSGSERKLQPDNGVYTKPTLAWPTALIFRKP